MTGTRGVSRRSFWQSAWPFWALGIFAVLPVVRLLPEGYIRAALAAPILFVVPGSLTLAAVFSHRSRPRGLTLVCYAALIGVIWSALASLLLYIRGVSITAASTYWCLLIVSAMLAVGAEVRFVLDQPGKGRRVVGKSKPLNPEVSDSEAGMGYYIILAVVAGASLLASGLYAYDHLSHPAPSGYTWMAWTGPRIEGDVAIGSNGTKLHFQIVHRQTNTTAFRLSATWMGSPSTPLAKPLTLNIGPNRTFRGSLFVPPLPNGCTYRIVVALTATRQIDSLTKKPQSWSINADVHNPNKSSMMCKQ